MPALPELTKERRREESLQTRVARSIAADQASERRCARSVGERRAAASFAPRQAFAWSLVAGRVESATNFGMRRPLRLARSRARSPRVVVVDCSPEAEKWGETRPTDNSQVAQKARLRAIATTLSAMTCLPVE